VDQQQRYRDWELERVAPLPDGSRLLKIVGYHSESHYLRLSEEEFDRIRKIITGQE
jgi:hypothetical protein